MDIYELTPSQLQEIEDTHAALELFVSKLEVALDFVEIGDIENCQQSLVDMYNHAKLVLDGAKVASMPVVQNVSLH